MTKQRLNVKEKFHIILDQLGSGKNISLNPSWNKHTNRLSLDFNPYPPANFLRHPILLYTMFVNSGGNWMNAQLNFLESQISSASLKKLLKEDIVGHPIIKDSNYHTSHNSIHHLYHLIFYEHNTGKKLKDFQTVVEWGGGYGNIAKIYYRYVNKPVTYILIDIPLFCAIQWFYLANIFGEEKLNIIHSKNNKIVKNKFNLVSLPYLKKLDLKADLFISTWALSESPKADQDYCFTKNFFGSNSFLLAYQKNDQNFPYARRLQKYAIKRRAKIVDINFIQGENRYAFK